MKVLITRPIEEAISLQQKLILLGYDAVICPLLEVEIFSNLDLHKLELYDAIIISSRNAIKAISKANKDIKLFIVGEETTEFAKSLGFINARHAGANMRELKETVQGCGKLLYLSGMDISDNLDSLAENVERLVVYQAKMVEVAPDGFLDFIKLDSLKLCTFFSERTAKSFLSLIHKYNLESYSNKIIALSLSDKISKILQDLALYSNSAAEEPNLRSVINSIKRYKND